MNVFNIEDLKSVDNDFNLDRIHVNVFNNNYKTEIDYFHHMKFTLNNINLQVSFSQFLKNAFNMNFMLYLKLTINKNVI